jgi:hypothetical protein
MLRIGIDSQRTAYVVVAIVARVMAKTEAVIDRVARCGDIECGARFFRSGSHLKWRGVTTYLAAIPVPQRSEADRGQRIMMFRGCIFVHVAPPLADELIADLRSRESVESAIGLDRTLRQNRGRCTGSSSRIVARLEHARSTRDPVWQLVKILDGAPRGERSIPQLRVRRP